jgi:hypothetical protein
LVIRPDKHTGITLRQARRAAQFVDDFRDNLWNRCDASGSFP